MLSGKPARQADSPVVQPIVIGYGQASSSAAQAVVVVVAVGVVQQVSADHGEATVSVGHSTDTEVSDTARG